MMRLRLIGLLSRFSWITYLALLALGIYIGTHVSSRSMESQRDQASPSLLPPSSPAVHLQDKLSSQPYAAIQESHLSGRSGPTPVPAPKLSSPRSPTTVPTKASLNLKLIGTMVGSAERSYALIEDLNSQRRLLYRIDEVVQGAKILEISRNRVVLDNRGHREELLIHQDLETTLPPTEATPEPTLQPPSETIEAGNQADVEEASSPDIRQIGDNEWSISRDEISKQFEQLHQLLGKARLIPHFRDDHAAGFMITRLSTKSFLEQIGLRNGDVLTAINGQKLNTLEDALNAYQSLQSESLLQLDIERNWRKETFSYEIR